MKKQSRVRKKRSKRNRMVRKLGNYVLGIQKVDLYIDYQLPNANIKLWPEDASTAAITIGLKYKWQDALDALIHEALELVTIQMGLRYIPNPCFANSAADFLFSMNHQQWQEMIARASLFLLETIPVVQKAAEARHGKKKKR